MNRRRYLALVGASASLAGCTSSSNGGSTPTQTATRTETPTPTPTDTRTATPTPEPLPPEILFVNPVTRWDNYNDASANRVESIGKGGFLRAAARYRIWNHDGTVALTKQAEFLDESDDRVAIEQSSSEQLTSGKNYQSWESVLSTSTEGWKKGRYEIQMQIRDDILNVASDIGTAYVELVEPLTGEELSVEYTGPTTVNTDTEFSFNFRITNNTDRDSSLVTYLQSRESEDSQWYDNTDAEYRYNIPAGETVERPSEPFSIYDPGTYQYRFAATDDTWTVEVA